MTPDGSLIAIGSRGYQTLLYDRNGTLVFSHSAAVRSDLQGPDPGVIRNYPGVTSVSLSSDGKSIAAGYADSVIRIFARQDAITAGAGWNLVGNSVNAPITVATRFNDATTVASVWKWVSQGNSTGISYPTWAFYTPSQSDGGQAYASSKGYEFLDAINAGEGFWINAKTNFDVALPTGSAVSTSAFQNMSSGWHLIAMGENKTPAAFNTNVTATTLWAWDNVLSKWYFYAPSLQSQGGTILSEYIRTNGYLDFTVASKTVGPGVGFWVNIP